VNKNNNIYYCVDLEKGEEEQQKEVLEMELSNKKLYAIFREAHDFLKVKPKIELN
jgi:hypothetical protein